MLKYRIIKQKNALDKDKKEMYFPRLTSRQKYDVWDVAEEISSRSTLSNADILATLISLEEIIPELLKMGSIVNLGRLGTFSIQANAETSPTPEGVSWRSFKSVKAKFRPGEALKMHLFDVNFKRV